MNFTRLRMNTLAAERNGMKDDTESQRRAMANAKKWQDDESAKIFSGRSGPAPSESTLASSRGWPRSSMTTTTVDQLERQARIQAEAEVEDEDLPTMAELGIIEDMGGAKDAEPSTLSFYAGKSYQEGRRAHNAYRASKGFAPIPEGSK
jgi:hypothetical protein